MVTIIKPEEFKTNPWLGGTTRELFIFPPDGSYKDRDFQFRISSAAITDPESVFTKLEGISRKLCLLDGNLTLKFNGSVHQMEPYDVCEFDGSWETSSIGVAEDLNLMYRGCKGEMQVLFVTGPVIVKANVEHQFFYSREQEFFVTVREKEYKLQKGELLYLLEENDIIKLRPETEGRNPLIHITCKKLA
jgi:environmental stress-induced protein Ves